MGDTSFRCALVALLITSGGFATAQSESVRFDTIRFEHLTINDGLSQSSVNALIQDTSGFLWVGTQDGLNRFDGYEFVVYRHDGDDDASLASNNVSSLLQDTTGALWVGTSNGYLHRYDRSRDAFERFQLSPGARHAPSDFFDDIRYLLEASDGRFWVGTRALGLWEFDRATVTFTNISAIGAVRINRMLEGPDGVLWIGTDERGLLWFEPSTGTVESADPGTTDRIYAIGTIGDEIWSAGNDGEISRHRTDRQLLDRFSVRLPGEIQRHQIRAMLNSGDGHMWVGMIGGGMQVYTGNGERVANFRHAPADPYSLRTDTAFTLLLDNAGVLWIGTLASGLSKANLSGTRFDNYWHQPDTPTSLGHNMVNEFAEAPDGTIWIGTSGGGVNRLDRDTGEFARFIADERDENTLSGNRVWGMHLDDAGYLWVGTWGTGLNRLDTASGDVQRIPIAASDPDALPGAIVTAIVSDGDDGLWIGTADAGLIHTNRSKLRFERRFIFDEEMETDRPVNVSTMFLDSGNRLWVGLWSKGLCVLAPDTDSFRCHAYDPLDDRSINDNNIRDIAEDRNGRIWIATANGVARFEEESERFSRITVSDSLPQGTIYAVVPQGDDVLWLSSNQGLARYDMVDGSVRAYDYKDGLQANEFNGASKLVASDGRFFFGGIGGITSFLPEQLAENTVPPKVVIMGLSLFNEPVPVEPGNPDALLQKSIDQTEQISLRHSQDVISLNYAGLHFVSPALNRYAHKLEGFDRDWVRTDASQRTATYTNLDPGEYQFMVRAANSDGLWSERAASLRITVLPPWWNTLLARTTLTLLAVLTVFLLIRWRLSTLKAQTRVLESEVRERTQQLVEQKETIEDQASHLEELLDAKNRFFARISHEFRTPITLMLGPIEEQLDHVAGDDEKRAMAMARRNGRRLLHLVDQLLGLARYSSEKPAELKPVNLAPIARLVADNFLALLDRKQLSLHRDIEDAWVNGDAEGLQVIVTNLLSNAVKYTDDSGQIELCVRREESDAVLCVADSGVGIAADRIDDIFTLFERADAQGPGSGIGLALVKEVADAHGGSIDVSSEPGEGSRFLIRIPALTGTTGVGDPAAILGESSAELFIDAGGVVARDPEPIDDSELRPRVLVVEDNVDMRQYIADVLGDDFACLEAANGQEGVQLARTELPDLIVSDVMMPQRDGFELLAELRADDHTNHIPVILLTALDDQESRIRGLSEKADDYLSKPFDRQELLLRARNLLELARIRARRLGQQWYATDSSQLERASECDDMDSHEQAFLQKLEGVVEANYHDSSFRLDHMAEQLNMSPRQLQRKLRALLDTAPAAFLRDYRLKAAYARLAAGATVTDVAYATGFSSVSYFGKCFRSRFGAPPSDVQPD